MANTTVSSNQQKCMGCGAPIASGFFCLKCEEAGSFDDGSPKPKPAGARFHGTALRDRKKDLLVEDLTRWGKRLLVLAVIGGGGWFVWANWGPQIESGVRNAMGWTKPQERYDPTKDREVVDPETGEALEGTKRRPLSNTKFGRQQSGYGSE